MTTIASVLIGPVQFPAGSVVDHIVVSATGSAAGNTTPITQSVPAQTAEGTVSVTFDLIPDTYILSAVAVDAAGNEFGAPVTFSKVVTSPSITLLVPTAISA
jgi:hypothetical protein